MSRAKIMKMIRSIHHELHALI